MKTGIRRYDERDLDAVTEVWYAASRQATPFLSEEFLSEERRNIRDLWMPQAETWVYDHDIGLVAFTALLQEEVGGLFVRPDAQGQGIGRALMDHAVSLRGRLCLDVFEDNVVGRRFYGRYGFEQIGEHVHEATGLRQIRLEFRAGWASGQAAS